MNLCAQSVEDDPSSATSGLYSSSVIFSSSAVESSSPTARGARATGAAGPDFTHESQRLNSFTTLAYNILRALCGIKL